MAYSMLTIFVNGHCNLMLLAKGYIYAYLHASTAPIERVFVYKWGIDIWQTQQTY